MIDPYAAAIALIGLSIAMWAAMRPEVEPLREGALIGVLGVLLMILGVAFL